MAFLNAGDKEKEIYWFHPDHLGSSSYITGLDGEVTQNIEYFPSGEVFVENHNKASNNSPYKFNGKELDAETGYYYYGARYYNPRVSLWLNVYPLADYNPFYNDEHYIDGEHNGGVYNSGNNNPYIYCYQNPVIFVDPNGKQNYSSIIGGKFSGLSRAIQDGAPRVATQAATVGAVGVAVVLDVFVTKGWASRGLLAYSAGNAAHSMQMQTYWRDRGNETEAQKYKQEGAVATKDLVIVGGLGGVARIARGLKTFNKLCFVKGTLITTLEGYKEIEKLKVGDEVWSYNESIYKNELKKVIALSKNTVSEIIEINAEGVKIECTPEHPFYVGVKWVEAKYLKAGDRLYLKDGSKLEIAFIQKNVREQEVYNFEVEDNHNYYVSEKQILVHNDCGFLKTNNKFVNNEIGEVVAGRGTPRLDADGDVKIFRGNEYLSGRKGYGSQKNWIGAEEYEAGGAAGSHNRILKKVNSDGSVKYGYSETYDYKVIHEIKKSN